MFGSVSVPVWLRYVRSYKCWDIELKVKYGTYPEIKDITICLSDNDDIIDE